MLVKLHSGVVVKKQKAPAVEAGAIRVGGWVKPFVGVVDRRRQQVLGSCLRSSDHFVSGGNPHEFDHRVRSFFTPSLVLVGVTSPYP